MEQLGTKSRNHHSFPATSHSTPSSERSSELFKYTPCNLNTLALLHSTLSSSARDMDRWLLGIDDDDEGDDDDVDDGEKWEEAEEQEEQENEIEIWTSTPAECSTYLSMSVFQCCLSTSGRNGSVWCLIGSSRTPPHTWSRTLLRRPRCFYQRNHRPGSHSPRASRLFYIFSLKTKQSIPWLMPSIPYNGSRKIVNFSELIGPLPCSRTGIAWRIPSLDLETAEMRWMITVIKPVVRVAELNKKMNQLDWQLTESLK